MPEANEADLEQASSRRVVLVTGAYGAIGKAIARQIAAQPSFEVVLAGRSEARLQQAAQDIRQVTGSLRVRAEVVDVAQQASIEALAKRWQGPLHVLVNNAASSPRKRQETPQRIEVQFATNVMGYFWMIQAFLEVLKRSAPSRVVNVASYWAGDLEIDDLEFKRRQYNNHSAYRQSKQADRMLTVAFAERLQPFGIVVNACHPGDVNSKLSNDLGFGGHESPDDGADTPVWLATSPEGDRQTGRYFADRQPVRCRFGEDRQAVEGLHAACLRYRG